MDQKTIPGILLIGGLLVSAAGWSALPTLQSKQESAQTQVAVAVERARRLLNEFNHRIVQKSLLLDDLTDADVDVDIEDAQQLLETATDDYQQRHTDRWATFQPNDYALPDAPRNAKAGDGNLAKQVQDGIWAGESILPEHQRLGGEARG